MTETFSDYRGYLFTIAYRMLGSVMDAEDMVQETYLRWRSAAREKIESPKSYLATIITRLCIDHLRSARIKRETYVGPWLPEPLLQTNNQETEGMAALADSLSIAFLVLLENLSPVERAVFLLREVFDFDYNQIAHIVQKSEANCRQIARRARERVTADRPRFETTPQEQQQILFEFVQACANGDLSGLMALLAEDAVQYSDGGGKVAAARLPITGADRVARFWLGIVRQAPADSSLSVTRANGQPALKLVVNGRLYGVVALDVANGRIHNIYTVINPDKLRHLLPHSGGADMNTQ